MPAGPGFHRAAAELIQALGEKEIKDMEWKDSTGYLEDPDFEALRRDTFEPWLAEQLNQALEELDRDPEGEVRLFWDEDQYWPEKVPGTVVTPVGRFSRAVAGGASGAGRAPGAERADVPVERAGARRPLPPQLRPEAAVGGLLFRAL